TAKPWHTATRIGTARAERPEPDHVRPRRATRDHRARGEASADRTWSGSGRSALAVPIRVAVCHGFAVVLPEHLPQPQPLGAGDRVGSELSVAADSTVLRACVRRTGAARATLEDGSAVRATLLSGPPRS